jgi:hypothetical protein
MSSTALPILFSEKEAAAKLRCSPATLGRERRRKRIGHVLIGSQIFYTMEQIIFYIESRTLLPSWGDGQQQLAEGPRASTNPVLAPSDAVEFARAVFAAKRPGSPRQ